jgi:spoIIIJ-associated protein
MSQRFEGRNLEEALQAASQTLGVDRWALTYHVLLEKRGFLGGMKRVVIEADVNTDGAPPAPAPVAAPVPASTPVVAPASAPTFPREPRAPRSAPRASGGGGGGDRRPRGRGRGGDRERGPSRGGRRGGGPRRDHATDELQSGDFEQFFGEIPEQGEETPAAKLVHDWCDEILDLSRLDVVARTEEKDEQIIVRMYGRDGRRLTDRHGEVLDAIQVLANKALVGRKVEKEIELDCEAFKDRRVDELGQRARDAADRVRKDGREELLPAMTPIERRIVHLALQDDADVTTESRGEGFYKRVAIIPRPADVQPTEP